MRDVQTNQTDEDESMKQPRSEAMTNSFSYYTAVEESDLLTVMEEFNSLFEATCHFFEMVSSPEHEDVDEFELGQLSNDDMIPILVAD